ncbi:hypothetical protein RDABS01_003070 [Bienertia sinuspersici]
MFILQRRLERIKVNCMKWCLNDKKEVGLNWANFNDKLQETTSLEIGREEWEKTKIRKRIEEEAREKWDYWRQRAKSKWDDWGDKSTGFFFRSIESRATKNEIRAIKNEENQWITENCEIKSTFHNYFKELLRPESMRGMNEEERRQWFSDVEPISSLHHQNLEAPFSMEEIKKGAFSMKPNKTLGLDGIPPGFIQTYWETLKDDIFHAATAFVNSGHLLKEINQTFITLIPKTPNPENVPDFRPISLCNTIYKIFSKCLVNRLKGVIREIGGEFQNAFIPGRLMNDNCLLAHEIINWVKQKKKGKLAAAVLKIDLSKAYDRIN